MKKNCTPIASELHKTQDVEDIFENFCKKFLSDSGTVDEFLTMFLNIISDFLKKKIDENVLSALIHKSLFDTRTRKYYYEPFLWEINDFLAVLFELLDITWTKDSENYAEYLIDLQKKYQKLVSKYHPS